MAVTRDFILAGKAVFTIEVPPGTTKRDGKTADPHYTYMVERVEATERWPEAYFVKTLVGPDNTSDFAYLGKLDPFTGEVKATAKTPVSFNGSFRFRMLNRLLARIWTGDHASYEQFGYATHHEGQCGRCGRRLTTPDSVRTGIGPECCKILGIAQSKRPVKIAKSTDELVVEASDERGRYLLALENLEEHRDSEGEVVFWTGKHEGKLIRVLND